MRLGLVFGLYVALSSCAFGQEVSPPISPESKGPQPPLSAWNGSYSYSIPIEVPAFRGLEPDLALNYDSARGLRNMPSAGGLLGLGWAIDGLPVVERVSGSLDPTRNASGVPTVNKASGGRGLPAYGTASLPSDNFMVDGSELIACTDLKDPTQSPSCTQATNDSGVRYTTRFERFQKIRFNTAANRWEITGRDGTLTTYAALDGGTSDTSFRWQIQSVKDPKGNHVDYSWSCAADFDCVIAKIEYFNAPAPASNPASLAATTPLGQILFNTDDISTDLDNPYTYASGKDMRVLTRRFSAIQVSTVLDNGTLSAVRRYDFTYQAAAGTGLSLLSQVQKVGLNGTAVNELPYQFTYSGAQSLLMQNWQQYGSSSSGSTLVRGDFNGDGLSPDFYYTPFAQQVGNTTNCVSSLWLSTGTQNWDHRAPACKAEVYDDQLLIDAHNNFKPPEPGDFDGDGADDYVELTWAVTTPSCCNQYEATLKFWRWNGTKFSNFMTVGDGNPKSQPEDFNKGVYRVADFTGDGRADILSKNGAV